MKRLLPFLLLLSASCASMKMQSSANDMQASVDGFVSEGHRSKDDFVRRFGVPTDCASLKTGELCEWDANIGSRGAAIMLSKNFAASRHHAVSQSLRVEFDKDGNYVGCQATMRRGSREYAGAK